MKYLRKPQAIKHDFFRFRRGDVTIRYMEMQEAIQDVIYKNGLGQTLLLL